jgi:hypothetical protein
MRLAARLAARRAAQRQLRSAGRPRLLNRYLDEFAYVDACGLDIMVNEHHSTATCLTTPGTDGTAIIARETKNARLLARQPDRQRRSGARRRGDGLARRCRVGA